ncbi:MAG: vacuolar membrane-associated protein iml1 [Trichoglossum hirsutum]|nr:MAG: vacuolar membrane-associated protein iml1 [Trichoglossum hirsutum]
MSNPDIPTPFRGPPRSSHLRQISNVSTKTISSLAPHPSTQGDYSAAQDDSSNSEAVQPKHIERVCTLWVHEDNPPREDVIMNFSLFPKDSVRIGDLAEIVALRPNSEIRDFQDAIPKNSKDAGTNVSEGPTIGVGGDRKRSPSNALNLEEAINKPQQSKRYVFIAKDMSSEQRAGRPNLQISLAAHIANAFGFRNKSLVVVSVVDRCMNTASHVELTFKDLYLSRSDMWRLAISELSDKTIYKGQKILFLGTIKAYVRNIFVRGQRVQSALFSANTKPIFRSESARYILFIQMSREMWDFDSEGTGQIMFNKVVNGFLPELFKRWTRMNARHLVSIILFTRVEYEEETDSWRVSDADGFGAKSAIRPETAGKKSCRDFFRVVITDMASGEWTTILYQLKKEFKIFLRDILIQPSSCVSKPKDGLDNWESDKDSVRPEYVIAGYPSAAIHGNILEAINLASSQFSHDYIDRDLIRTGISIVVITPGTGYFEVDYEMLKMTTETLVGNGIGIDLVCLSKMPLHSVPLFKYRSPKVQHSPETPANGQDGSPPQIKYGSYSSRTRLSPSKISEFAASPGSSSNETSKIEQEWSYAVPHWIDVSFWSGGMSGSGLQQPGDYRRGHVAAGGRRYDRKAFVPRCRMYELQMMGIMENEISNISIPYLHEDPFYNPPPQTFRVGAKLLNSVASTNATSSEISTPTGPRTLETSRGLTPALAKIERDIPHRENRDAYKWMDEYDEWVFRPLPSVRAAIKEIRSKQAREEHQKLSQQLQDDGPSVYGTSISDQRRIAPAGTAYFDRKMKERRPSPDRTSERKVSTSSVASTNTLKPLKLSRHISFGLRGFGVGTPKATASTELQTEHEKPGSILTRGFQTPSIIAGSLKDSQTSSPAKDGNTPANQAGSLRVGLSPVKEPSHRIEDNDKSPSRPIAIKSAVASLEQAQHGRPKSFVGSVFDVSTKDRRESEKIDVLQAASMTKQAGPKIDIAAAAPAAPPTLSPTSALAPWMTVLNPSNPGSSNEEMSSHFRRWQHVFPRPLRTSSVKWKSLCSPAAVPLTTEYFPTAEQLATEYHENPYSISQNDDDEPFENPMTREDLMRELISLRLSQGFQLVVGPAVATAMGKSSSKIVDVFHKGFMAHDGAMVFMSMGNHIHQLLCVEKGQDVEVKRFVRKPTMTAPGGASRPVNYKARIRPLMGDGYVPREIIFQPSLQDYNWNYVDSFIAGHEEALTENLRFWRARFVLIPVDQPANARRPLHSSNEDNEEEIRIEGIRRLSQMWQRHRYISPEERQRHDSSSWSKKKDPNPLDIIYRTRDPSEVIAAELDALQLLDSEPNARRSQLFAESELFSRSNVGMQALALAIQGERGVKMQDRRWHLRLHYNCFIGAELTTWLQENFKDIDDRDEAVEFGNELMKNGLFQHVEKRHKFRDGNYFYQISSEFRNIRPESRGGGWFGTKRSDKSVPSTPMSETSRDSPRHDLSRSGSNDEYPTTDSGVATPRTGPNGKKLKITLSKSMKYDVDHRRKSYRPELVTLHYDRLHNPDNCYHIRADWMNVTAKLIEDAITQWANLAEKYGLKLVEVPIAEACEITATRPFRSPAVVRLAVTPPCKPPVHFFDTTSFGPHQHADRYYYHKAIMRKFNFVLDLEAATNFTTDVEVEYSTGKPTYRYSQYIHCSGAVLAQITDEGGFILLANRTHSNSTAAAREQTRADHHTDRHPAGNWGFTAPSNPISSRTTNSDGLSNHSTPAAARPTPDIITGMSSAYATPQRILQDFSAFCNDSKALCSFYDEVCARATSPGHSLSSIPTLDMSLTSSGTPLSLVRGESPSPVLGMSGSGPGSTTAGVLGREGREGSGSTQGSRGSMAEAPPG